MNNDLVTDAENALDAAIAAEEAGQQPNPDDAGQQPPAGGDGGQPPAGDDPNNQPNPDEEPGNGQNNGDPQGGEPKKGDEEDPNKGKEPNPDEPKPQGDEAQKPLTDEQLIEEAKKRGIDLAKKEEPKEEPKIPEIARPTEIPEQTWGEMNPVNRYIYNELPYLNVQGVRTVGEGDDAKQEVYTLKVKTPEQIPDDFEFASPREQAKFNSDITAQSSKAEKMLADIRQNAESQKQQTSQAAENKAIYEGVEELQKQGIVPKITADPNDKAAFAADPGVQRAEKILAYRYELLQKGENVSVVSAGKMFKADNPDLYKEEPPKPNADDERKNKSANVNGGGRGTQQQAKKTEDDRPKFPPGTSASDIADYYNRDLD